MLRSLDVGKLSPEALGASLVALVLVVTASSIGVVRTLQAGIGLGRFGGTEYIPRIVCLAMTRGDAAGAAGLATYAGFMLGPIGRRLRTSPTVPASSRGLRSSPHPQAPPRRWRSGFW